MRSINDKPVNRANSQKRSTGSADDTSEHTDINVGNQQVEGLREKIKSSLYQIRTRALRDAPVYLQHVNIAEQTLLQHFTTQLTIKDEQHAKELELARIEAKIGLLSNLETDGVCIYLDNDNVYLHKDYILSELIKQKEKLLNEGV